MFGASTEDARSDLMLSVAAFIFGPLLLRLVLGLFGVGTGNAAVRIVLVALATLVVPILLMRYRREGMAAIGLRGKEPDPTVLTGLVAALPLIAASLAGVLVGIPVFAGAGNPLLMPGGDAAEVVVRLVAWGGVLFLALYTSTKARDAFGGDPQRVMPAALRIGRVLAIVAAVSGVLVATQVVLGGGDPIGGIALVVVWPLAVIAMVLLVLRRTGGVGTTTLPTLVVPTLVGALGNFVLSFDPTQLAIFVYQASLSGGIGLAAGLLADRTRRGGGVLLLGVLIALLTTLGTPARLG